MDAPEGCWIHADETPIRFGASLKSWHFWPYLFFTLFFNGGLGLMLFVSLRAPLSQSWWMILFLLPFTFGGLCLIAVCFLTAAGRVEFRISSTTLALFTGVGSLGHTRNLQISDIRSVGRVTIRSDDNTYQHLALTTTTGRTIKFARLATDLRRDFLLSALSSFLPLAPDSAPLDINPPLKR